MQITAILIFQDTKHNGKRYWFVQYSRTIKGDSNSLLLMILNPRSILSSVPPKLIHFTMFICILLLFFNALLIKYLLPFFWGLKYNCTTIPLKLTKILSIFYKSVTKIFIILNFPMIFLSNTWITSYYILLIMWCLRLILHI